MVDCQQIVNTFARHRAVNHPETAQRIVFLPAHRGQEGLFSWRRSIYAERRFTSPSAPPGKLVQQSLETTNERIARDRKRQVERELLLGKFEESSDLPLPTIVAAFCDRKTNRTMIHVERAAFSVTGTIQPGTFIRALTPDMFGIRPIQTRW